MGILNYRFAKRIIVQRCDIGFLRGGCAFLTAGILFLSALDHSAAQTCPQVYNGQNGWIIEACPSDRKVTDRMEVVVDGVSRGSAVLVRVYHKSQNSLGTPQVAVIYASGFVRLKQNADPSPSIPFGSSFVLGPAYWRDASTYYHNPQVRRLEIDTTWLPGGPLRMHAEGSNHDFNVSYDISLPPPRDRQTRLHVVQDYTATANVNIDSTRRAESQGFKLVQISSMFINQGGSCDGGKTDCHDSNGARFIASDMSRQQVSFSNIPQSHLIFNPAMPLGSTWVDALHTDDQGWQGNTPNARIALDGLPSEHTITPQGWINASTNPNDDNVGLWLHDDGPASQSWTAGQSGRTSYWLMTGDNPPEPWSDLGLRSGTTLLDFEHSFNAFFVKDNSQPTSGRVDAAQGYSDSALRLAYDLGQADGNWTQIRINFDPPLDLSAYDHLRFEWTGAPRAANSLEVGLIDEAGGVQRIFARGFHHATHRAWWGQLVIPFDFLPAWTPGTTFNRAKVVAFIISVKKDGPDDSGGAGSITIDNISAFNAATRRVPSRIETASGNAKASLAAAQWLAAQQRANGLLKSWEQETDCISHTYDQALALIVFSGERMWARAYALVDALVNVQNADGSWFKSRNCQTLEPTDTNKWEGDIAWAIYALSRYIALGGSHPGARDAMRRGAGWLAGRVSAGDGCLVIDHTEATIDAWWALQSAGPEFATAADRIKNCLLTEYWDERMGRFRGGKSWLQAYLDNQTWGSAFLEAIGEDEKARRALSYARDVLRLPAQGGQLFGFDGQGGPWSVWNEGTSQYIATGGEGANDLIQELLAQQRTDGAMPGSPDEFLGGGVWTPRWYGVAPTAWLYNSLSNGMPFRDFSVSLDSASVTASPGQKVKVKMNIARVGGFAGDVTIETDSNKLGELKIKAVPSSISTSDSSASFKLKIKSNAPTGLARLVFTARDDSGRTREVALALNIIE